MTRGGKNLREVGEYLKRSVEYVGQQTSKACVTSFAKNDCLWFLTRDVNNRIKHDFGWRESKVLYDFQSEKMLRNWIIGSDADIGGMSKAYMKLLDPTNPISSDSSSQTKDVSTPSSTTESAASLPETPAVSIPDSTPFSRFHGSLSLSIPPGTQLDRSGYAAIRSKSLPPTLFHSPMHDCSLFRYLVLRVRIPIHSPARTFMLNIQTASMMYPTYLYQHHLNVKSRGDWEELWLPFRDFTLTAFGFVQKRQLKMDTTKIKTIGVSISRQEGDFALDVDWIKAVNSEYTFGEIDLSRSLKQQYEMEKLQSLSSDASSTTLSTGRTVDFEEIQRIKDEMEKEKARLKNLNRVKFFDDGKEESIATKGKGRK